MPAVFAGAALFYCHIQSGTQRLQPILTLTPSPQPTTVQWAMTTWASTTHMAPSTRSRRRTSRCGERPCVRCGLAMGAHVAARPWAPVCRGR